MVNIKFEVMNKIFKFSWTKFKFSFLVIRKPDMDVVGMTSRCADLLHVVFLDYDFIERQLVEEELKLLQHKFKLPPFYLFTTKEEVGFNGEKTGNYHAISLIKLPMRQVSEIQLYSSCDWKYKKMFQLSRYKSWVLRVTSKGDRPMPVYLGLVGDAINLNKQVSNVHLKQLHALYSDLDEVKYSNIDALTKCYITSYYTARG